MKLSPSDPTNADKMQRKKPVQYLCYFCNSPASFGYGYGGLDVPAHRKGRMWVCFDHREDAERRRDLAYKEDSPFGKDKSTDVKRSA